MFYIPPKKPKHTVIYTRTDPEQPCSLTARDQAEICLRYCRQNRLPVSHIIHVTGSPEESLDYMRQLVRILPKEVDTLLAAGFYAYTTLLPELARLCLIFQCRPTWIYSLDAVGLLHQSLYCLEPEDYFLADVRYQNLLEQKG